MQRAGSSSINWGKLTRNRILKGYWKYFVVMLISFGVAYSAFELIPNQYGDLRKAILFFCFAMMAIAIAQFQLKMRRKE